MSTLKYLEQSCRNDVACNSYIFYIRSNFCRTVDEYSLSSLDEEDFMQFDHVLACLVILVSAILHNQRSP
jgi:hypothetical protein